MNHKTTAQGVGFIERGYIVRVWLSHVTTSLLCAAYCMLALRNIKPSNPIPTSLTVCTPTYQWAEDRWWFYRALAPASLLRCSPTVKSNDFICLNTDGPLQDLQISSITGHPGCVPSTLSATGVFTTNTTNAVLPWNMPPSISPTHKWLSASSWQQKYPITNIKKNMSIEEFLLRGKPSAQLWTTQKNHS